MTRKIFAQGDLDGACYLYSIANSYVALKSIAILKFENRPKPDGDSTIVILNNNVAEGKSG